MLNWRNFCIYKSLNASYVKYHFKSKHLTNHQHYYLSSLAYTCHVMYKLAK